MGVLPLSGGVFSPLGWGKSSNTKIILKLLVKNKQNPLIANLLISYKYN